VRTPRSLLVALALVAAGCGDDSPDISAPVDTSRPAVSLPAAPTMPRPTSPGAGTLPVAPGATDTTAPPAETTPPDTLPPEPTPADLAGVRVELTLIADLREPVDLVSRPGDPTGLHVAERVGRVSRLESGERTTVLDMQDRTVARGEQGLLGLTYSPDGGRLYVHYTEPDGTSVVDEYTMGADGTADPASRRELLRLAQPFPNHNGGEIVTGPDGLLYIGFGDGGSANDPLRAGLDTGTWLGKILRIDPTPAGDRAYSVPPGNPFAGGGGLPEIWSFGLRNPWRFSFDPLTADLWVADVGQNAVEEVNLVRAADGSGWGVNFGWSAFEGTRRFHEDQPPEGALGPVHEYEHGDLGCSISGGEVYRGTAIPGLAGAYVFADYCVPGIRAIPAGPGPWPEATVLTGDGRAIAGFGRGPDGEVYALSLNGPVYRLDPA
jgi:glucose/arabinose dehydrogenase